MSDGTVITRPVAPTRTLPRDICHNHACATTAFHGGKMDRFDKVTNANTNNDHLTYIRYTESQIPNYWQYARNFVLADHFFSSTLSQTFPGHFATVAGFNVALANPSVFISSYSIHYDTLSGPSTTQVSFYVPEIDANGSPVIDPSTGNPVTITFGTATASGN